MPRKSQLTEFTVWGTLTVFTVMEIKHCERCGEDWCFRGSGRPVRCGRCKSPYWDRSRDGESGAPRFAPTYDRPLVGTAVPAPKIAEAAENSRTTTPQDLGWADYDVSSGNVEAEEPEEEHDPAMCQERDCPKCRAIYLARRGRR